MRKITTDPARKGKEKEEKKMSALATEAPRAPLTSERKVRSDLEEYIPKPYLARALVAADVDHPNGTPGHENNGYSVLQQHVSYFDRNKDGVIYPWETFLALQDLGLNPFYSLFAATIIHIGLSYLTLTSRLPNPLLPIYIDRIHKCKHGSDTATYDTEGRFMPMNFESIFSKYARTYPDKISFDEVQHMIEANHNSYDILGSVVSKAEFNILFKVAGDEQNFVSKEALRGCYDGSLFHYIAKMRKSGDKKSH
ncbi:hypothetical protein DITRI_Ditri15bG0104800 [Diplodiscus trichospermus]